MVNILAQDLGDSGVTLAGTGFLDDPAVSYAVTGNMISGETPTFGESEKVTILYFFTNNQISVSIDALLYSDGYLIIDRFDFANGADGDFYVIYDVYIELDSVDQITSTRFFDGFLNTSNYVEGTDASDVLKVGGGGDTVLAHAGNDRAYGEAGDDRLQGGYGSDSLSGSTGRDTLMGEIGNDVLYGGSGSDRLIGAAGRDILKGGADSSRDVFDFNSRTETAVGTSRDVIENFTRALDDIDLTTIDANTSTATNDAFLFRGTTSAAYSVWYAVSGSSIIVRGDVNGNRVADFEIQVMGITSIAAGDFQL